MNDFEAASVRVTGETEPAQWSDERLAEACARGDSDAFEYLYRRHSGRMKSLAFNHVGDHGEAEDAVQETFVRVHRHAGSFSGDASFSTWMFRILVNTCLDVLRRRRRRPEAVLDDASLPPEEGEAMGAERVTLRRMIRALPERRRSVVLLHEVEGFSHSEIAKILEISEANSKWILFDTKRQLRASWLDGGSPKGGRDEM